MTVSRRTFDPAKNYQEVIIHEDRDALDSEINEVQDIIRYRDKRLADLLLVQGAILSGLEVTISEPPSDNILVVTDGEVYLEGAVQHVSGGTLTYALDSEGPDYVYLELLKYNYGAAQDPSLVNPATGEPTAEREKWVVALQNRDTSGDELPSLVTARVVAVIYEWNRSTNDIVRTVPYRSNQLLQDLQGTLDGSRITVSTITENQLNIQAAEGLGSLLDNMAERTNDESGSYLVRGMDTFIGDNDGVNVQAITNAGRAYIQGYRLEKVVPTTNSVPKSIAVRGVRGEQKTFVAGTRRYPLNNTPLRSTTQVEAICLIEAPDSNAYITKGIFGGADDLPVEAPLGPVVQIIEVKMGAETYVQGVDWQQSGNSVDWLESDHQPTSGLTYTVKWTYTRQMQRGVDYVDGGWFGEDAHPAASDYFYLVTVRSITGESEYILGNVVHRNTLAGQINRISWLPVAGAIGYRVFRGTTDGRLDLSRVADVAVGTNYYIDDGVDIPSPINHPPEANSSGLTMSPATIEQSSGDLVNFGRADVGVTPVNASQISIDYDYFLGRRDIVYATPSAIRLLQGAAADHPKLPIVPVGCLALCEVTCPANSVEMTVTNFGLTRVTMDRLHRLLQDVEDLKYNDARSQMNNDLTNRTSDPKKGIYSDDFSSTIQSDLNHPDWGARVDTVFQFAAPEGDATPNSLVVDEDNTNASLPMPVSEHPHSSLALLPATEVVLAEQSDWSESLNVNPFAVFTHAETTIQVNPTIGRRGQSGIAVIGSNFVPNVSGVTIRCDGQVMLTGVTTDSAGRFTASFTLPENIINGVRVVEASDGTYSASTQIQVNDPLVVTIVQRVEVTQVVYWNYWWWVWPYRWYHYYWDPLAQTFNFPQNQIVTAFGLYFTAKDAAVPITVQIRGVTAGMPNDQVFAERTLSPDEITLDGETKVIFDDPFYCTANTSYAIVLMTGSNNYRVRIATLGHMGQRGIITAQPYAPGVLLESSNTETWIPANDSDLQMKIYGYEFEPTGIIQFEEITDVQFSELALDVYSTTPENTGLIWEYSVDGGSTWDAMVPGVEEELPNLAHRVLVRVRMSTETDNDSPAMNFRDVHLIGYRNQTGSRTYITRQLDTVQEIESCKVYTQMNVPSGTTVNWFCSNDGGATWEVMTVEVTRPITSTWTEYTLGRTFTNPTGTRIRFKAVMSGTSLTYPRIHVLGATLA